MKFIAFMICLILAGPAMATTWHVSASGDNSNEGTEASPFATIQHAIGHSENGDIIHVVEGTYGGNDLRIYGKAITIQGALGRNGRHLTTVVNTTGHAVFWIRDGEGHNTVIQNLIIKGGYSSDYGGGIACEGASPTINNCVIKQNGSSEAGGGISCTGGSTAIISGCIITENTSQRGGGIFCQDSQPIIENCTVSENHATSAQGGGIYCEGTGIANMSFNVICGNTGGEIGCESGSKCYIDHGSGIDFDCNSSAMITALRYHVHHLSNVVNSRESIIVAQQTSITELQEVVEACCSSKCAGDHDSNGHIDVHDLLHIIATWGPCVH